MILHLKALFWNVRVWFKPYYVANYNECNLVEGF